MFNRSNCDVKSQLAGMDRTIKSRHNHFSGAPVSAFREGVQISLRSSTTSHIH